MDKNMDLNAIRQAAEQISEADFDTQETKVIGNNLADVLKATDRAEEPDVGEDDNRDIHSELFTEDEPDDAYDGPGLVINNEDLEKKEDTNVYNGRGVTPEVRGHIDEYLAEMDETIAELKERHEEIQEELESNDSDESTEDEEDNGMTKDEFDEKYNEAVVIIDKTGFGGLINFTDDEREKLEKSRKIKLEEVETVELNSIKTKKMKKKSEFDKIIKRVTNIHTTNIVLPISGYTATMRGCSAYELISLIEGNNNALLDAQQKWSLIHSKIESTSIGDMSFNDFLLNTAAGDYNIFIYGLLCSTYPDDDVIPLTCEHCKKDFDHKYSVKSLIRVEEMKDRLKDAIMTTVDASITTDSAKKAHDEAPISQVKRVKLPNSGIIAEVYVQSAYDLINKSIKDLADNKDPKYNQAAILSTLIRTFFIPDPDEEGSYYEVDSGIDIAKTLYTLNELDVMIIRRFGDNMLEDLSMQFGLMDITCPACKHFTATLEMDLESILFYRYRQAMTSKIE